MKFLAALKKWRDLGNELHETTVSLKNGFQETTLAATFNLGGYYSNEDKVSTAPKPEIFITQDTIDSDNQNSSKVNNKSLL